MMRLQTGMLKDFASPVESSVVLVSWPINESKMSKKCASVSLLSQRLGQSPRAAGTSFYYLE